LERVHDARSYAVTEPLAALLRFQCCEPEAFEDEA